MRSVWLPHSNAAWAPSVHTARHFSALVCLFQPVVGPHISTHFPLPQNAVLHTRGQVKLNNGEKFNMFGLFGKKNKLKETSERTKQAETKTYLKKECDYGSLAEITRILTNGDAQAIEDMTLLAKDSIAFMQKYKVWCDDMLTDITDLHSVTLVATAYWLTGYAVAGVAPPCHYGAYVDWKEAADDILWNLQEPIQNLGYSIPLSEISFSNQECTDEVLQIMNDYCVTQGYALVALDTDSDCYHLFIVKTKDFDKLVALCNKIEFKFSISINRGDRLSSLPYFVPIGTKRNGGA